MGLPSILVIVLYLLAIGFLGYHGFRRTTTASDYLVAGRKAHPFVMALSYGATFISTSAIVGFGGVAGLFGMSLLWLTFLNIFVGIFIAFVFLGGPTRRMGHHVEAHTFPELLGKRFDSAFIQMFSGFVIFLFMPLYASAVLIGGCEFIATQFGIPYVAALSIFSVIIAAYVVMGGLKGVMYADALQGSIMFLGMLILLVFTYHKVGGVIEGHQTLSEMAPLVPGGLRSIGHRGWTSMPKFGFGETQYNLWWIVVSTITLGVGVGVLAQPQLAVRFMTVRSKKELNRAVLVGGIFILIMTGVAFTVGALSNAYFARKGRPFEGRVASVIDEEKGFALLQVMRQTEEGRWVDVERPNGEKVQVPVVLDLQAPPLGTAVWGGEESEVVEGRSIAIVYAGGNAGQIIPTYIEAALPKWFGLLFLLTLLAAAMSTLSSQFHALGTSIGRDVYETARGAHGTGFGVTRAGIVVGILMAVVLSYYARESTFIARATAVFFGLCGSAFLPAYVGGLFTRRVTKTAAVASIVTGFSVTAFWLVFVKASEAQTVGLVQRITGGKTSILHAYPNWPEVDPVVIALPIAAIVCVAVSLFTKPLDKAHVDWCFGGDKPGEVVDEAEKAGGNA